jgi:hypothetical protein
MPCPSPGEILMQDDFVALLAFDRWANTKEWNSTSIAGG